MNTPSSMQALRRANPRTKPGFADSVAAAAETLHARIAATADVAPTGADLATAGADVTATGADLAAGTRPGARCSGRRTPPGSGRSTPRRIMVASTVGTLVAAAVVVVVLAVGMLPGAGPDVANAAAAVRKAATVTAGAAERSGTADVQITHDGQFWAGTAIRWRDGDLAVARIGRSRAGKAG